MVPRERGGGPSGAPSKRPVAPLAYLPYLAVISRHLDQAALSSAVLQLHNEPRLKQNKKIKTTRVPDVCLVAAAGQTNNTKEDPSLFKNT